MNIKIAYLTHESPTDKKSWSGIHYNMFHSLKNDGIEIVNLGSVSLKITWFLRAISFCARNIMNKQYLHGHSLMLSKMYGRKFRQRIQETNPDIIFAANASTEITHLGVNDVPIIYLWRNL